MRFEGFEVKNKYAQKVFDNFFVFCSRKPKYLLFYTTSDTLFPPTAPNISNIIIRVSCDYMGRTCMFFPLEEDKIFFNIYSPGCLYKIEGQPIFQKEYEINPDNTLFFSRENARPENLLVDHMVIETLFFDHRITPDKIKMNSNFDNSYLVKETFSAPSTASFIPDVVESFSEIYKKSKDSPATVGIRKKSLLELYGMLSFKGIIPLAIYNNKYILFKSYSVSPVLPLPGDTAYTIHSLYEAFYNFNSKLKDYYLVDREAYLFMILKAATEIDNRMQNILIRVSNYGEVTARIRVGKFGDIVIIPNRKNMPTFIVKTRDAKETAEMLDYIRENRVCIVDSDITLTNEHCRYAQIK